MRPAGKIVGGQKEKGVTKDGQALPRELLDDGQGKSGSTTLDMEISTNSEGSVRLPADMTVSQMGQETSHHRLPWLVMSATCWRHVGDKAKCRQFLPRQANFGDMVFTVSALFCVALFRHRRTKDRRQK
jgi:hypothetical protein